ncbi:MAG TPA: nucleotide pyrophosphatase/phosphodiesterase family protein, partial [Gaiellaceae bacterium]
MAKKLVLVVVDGMTPAAFERAIAGGHAPAMAFLAAEGDYRQATSVFPSLTPVCLTSIATGSGPGVHHIPSLVWWNREERRIVEYGSSLSALRAAGLSQSLVDTIFNMNARHLSRDAVTVYEALEDAGLVAAAVNITCYRGRHRYLPTVPGLNRAAFGPRRFFFYGLFESDRTGAPFAVRSRRAGSVDAYATAVGRWLVTRDGFDFLAFYLSGYDFASHAGGPDGAEADLALEQADAAIGALLDAAGGPDEFLERYAVVLLSDHGQTRVERASRLEEPLADVADEIVVAASNRAGQVYLRPNARVDAGELAQRLDGFAAVDVTLRREGDRVVARKDGEDAPVEKLDHPDAAWRARSALADPNAGELLVSAAEGWELADLGGRHHAGGGSHGSLVAGDSLVPLVTVGLEAELRRITDVAPAVLEHFGV